MFFFKLNALIFKVTFNFIVFFNLDKKMVNVKFYTRPLVF